jgi:uncharacterized protein involved in exopolysaccharide biosynthesis
MANPPNRDEGVDFSGYFGNPKQNQQQKQPAIIEKDSMFTISKRTKRLLLLLLLSILTFAGVLWYFRDTPKPAAPEGFKLVTPPGQPGYIEPIK